MGGTLGVESELGRGSTFSFTARVVPQPASASEAWAASDLRGLRLLAVDDHATNRRLVTALAQHWGLVAAEAPDALSALTVMRDAAAQGTPYDVAVLDLQMPGMDGLELARMIRADA